MRARVQDSRPLQVNYRLQNPKLHQLHLDRGKYDERFVFAGTGGGKTYGLCFEDLHITFTEPPSWGILAAPTFAKVKEIYYPTFAKLLGRPLDALEPYARMNKTDHQLTWWNGWVWQFVGLDKPQIVEGIPEATFVHLTEARLLRDFAGPDGAWPNLTRRLRSEQDRPKYAHLDTHSPTKEIWDYAHASPKRRVYQWSTVDAARWGTLSQADAERIAGGYTGAAAKRVLEGKYARAEGVCLDAFDRDRHVRPWNGKAPGMVYALDLGWDHPAVLGAGALLGDSVHLVEEVLLSKPGIKGTADAARALMERHGAGTLWVGWDVRAGEIVEHLRTYGIDARRITSGVAESILLTNQRFASGSLLIDPACTETIRQAEHVGWKAGAKMEPEKGDDDAFDMLRYLVVGASQRRKVADAW